SYGYGRAATDTAAARETLLRSLSDFYETHRGVAPGSKHLVEAAFRAAQLAKGAGSGAAHPPPSYRTWLERVVARWEGFRGRGKLSGGQSEAQGAPWVDYAAGAQLELLDEDIRTKLESTPGPLRTLEVAQKLDVALEAVARRYESAEHTANAIA